ncbi:hypothetical protein GCM10011374_38700 [Kocuria dechangensis]|uniref:Uncharacterized protein n=1 Tax=Kocuria dechangensis TaxID=1176249 RepID=A0A917H8B7_9MICC|nr:hypothetical protein GCM10011374_38700 [Kocuria dechangensis]
MVLAGVMLVLSLSLVGVVNGAGGPYVLGVEVGMRLRRTAVGIVAGAG